MNYSEFSRHLNKSYNSNKPNNYQTKTKSNSEKENTSQKNLPDGVYSIEDIEDGVRNGVINIYFMNESSDVAFVLKEDSEFPIQVNQNQAFIYPIEGAATPVFGVYKIKDFGSIYADTNGIIKPTGIISIIWLKTSNDIGKKELSWIRERVKKGDVKWLSLYNAAKGIK